MVNLREIRDAVFGYVNTQVTSTCQITPNDGNNIGPGETFNIETKVKNGKNAKQAIQLKNVRYHLKIEESAIAKLVNPFNPKELVSELDFKLAPPDDLLLEGETQTRSFTGVALAVGTAQVNFDVHVDPDLEYLFAPQDSNNIFAKVKVVD